MNAERTTSGTAFLAAWDNSEFIPAGAMPVRPWRRVPDQTIAAVADALEKVKAVAPKDDMEPAP